ncbi:MAG: DegQ family serine endoprotease [Deltaproteobacteria bacterium]|nr:DegQ family serine endoprotease [Deltaproteobacteria bacterium]MBI3386119.1 DegQ family serine endoprotease [Deltaproteobacteria bacterium]
MRSVHWRLVVFAAVAHAALSTTSAHAHSSDAAPPSFAPVAKVARPAVCHIFAAQGARPSAGGEPLEEFSRRFFGEAPPRNAPRRSLGSGFIISADGYIVTNAHVIRDATLIRVRLADKEEYDAKLIGSDPKTDVALIKIEPRGTLPTVRLGSSAALEVGDWVVAIGNPFGLAQTVTAGIVSAVGRVIGAGPYDDFIQTDASINPGNSGGPLLNLDGEVIGINSAIFSKSGGNVGIGFAIPIDLARRIIDQLREHGKVVRGWLGVSIQEMTADLAKSFGFDRPHGALIADVIPGGPAERGGLQRGDVIIEYQGHAVLDSQHFPTLVADTPVGSHAEVKVLRHGEEKSLTVAVAQLPEPKPQVRAATDSDWGLAIADLTPNLARRLGLPTQRRGIVITTVAPTSAAAEAGVQSGDIIREANRHEVSTVREYRTAIAGATDSLLLLLQRGEFSSYVALRRE